MRNTLSVAIVQLGKIIFILAVSAVFILVFRGPIPTLAAGQLQQNLDGGGGGEEVPPKQCADGIDNDGNGLVDYPADLGCSSAFDNAESGYTPPPPVITQCNDGIDNDGNGPIDYPADLGCTSSSDTTESGYVTTLCSNTLDDDGDGYVDLADTGCANAADTTEIPNPQCSDGADNDLNGKIDYPADLGCTSAYDTTEAGYVPPAVPGAGVVIYSDRPDYVNAADACTHGGVCSHFDSTHHGTGSNPSNEGQKTCQLLDPISWESYWESGGYHSCGNNNMINYTPSTGLWNLSGSCWSNNHYHIISCTTLAVPDTTLTANGQSTEITVTQGTPVTLTWNSTYGSIRKGTMTATNFDFNTWNPAYCVDVKELYCPGNALAKAGSENTKQLALSQSCFYDVVGQNCYPASLVSHPYGSSTTTIPTQTTTYTYTGTNANGSSFASVKVNVAGTTECSDLVSNGDNDSLIDSADPGCSINPPGCSGQSCIPTEHTDMPDLVVAPVTQTTATQGVATTLSATVTNQGGSATTVPITNTFQIDNDLDHNTFASVIYAQVTGSPSPALAKNATNLTSVLYTFPTAGTWYVRVCTDLPPLWTGVVLEQNDGNNCDPGVSGEWKTITVTSGVPVASLTASPSSVPVNDSSQLHWSCTNSTSASIDHGVGAVSNGAWVPSGNSGDVSSGPIAQTTTFTLTCTGPAGSGPGSSFPVTITVPVVTITANGVANSLTVKSGTAVTIAWTASADATSCKVSGPGLSSTLKNSSSAPITITSLSSYTINCNGSTKTVTVQLAPAFKEI